MSHLLKREEGISLVLVAILLVVLLGFAGIAIDLGSLWMERRALRNGADAAVLAIAEDCALGTKACDQATALATAEFYAASNSNDGAAGIDSLELDVGAKKVRVVTHALDAATGVRGFRVALMGIFGFDYMEVVAPAAAVWGYPASGSGLPLTIEKCEWEKYHHHNADFPATLMFHDGNPVYDEETPECPVGPAGQDAPGAFGWLDSPNDDCVAHIIQGTWTDNAGGGGVGQPPPDTGCDAAYIRDALFDKDIPIPVYSDVRGEGQVQYWMDGFAMFHVMAYKLGNRPGLRQPDDFDCPVTQAGADAACLQGYFTTGTLEWGDIGGEDYGVVIVRLVE